MPRIRRVNNNETPHLSQLIAQQLAAAIPTIVPQVSETFQNGSTSRDNGSNRNTHNGDGPLTDAIYKELWRACAGPLAYVPRVGERVYYFPQGHIEQIRYNSHISTLIAIHLISFEASVDNGLDQQLSSFCLTPKILCKVMNVQLLQSEITVTDPTLREPSNCAVHSLCKTLTESDKRTHEGFSFIHSQASLVRICSNIHTVNNWLLVIFMEMNGIFVIYFKVTGNPGHQMLTAGLSAFVRAKKCATGDGFVLLRGKKGEMFVGVRRHFSLSNNLQPTSVTLTHDQLVALSVASYAVATGTRFSVIYKPRCCRSSFIISVNKYLEAKNRIISVGMRFRMTFEDEQFAERRIARTVVGVADSEWKSVQVEWDELSSTILLPENVSSWELEGCKGSLSGIRV
ncbi:hypothetical protein L1987_20063 [Smallanthus sonchifolius]|uniref:Uncharacterized protein n=1 Tax=Smallanthus sonchifolius TaxID=185202 RepID=A0ACB9ISK9_9ASTR|nr:hypothetical protein L1987_20063 [Smallanthus sonchifolius]